MLSKQREIFKNIYHERIEKIGELTKKIDHNVFRFLAQTSGNKTDFTDLKDPFVFLDNIKGNEISI